MVSNLNKSLSGVQMLGTRGLPNRYGGAETCVEEVGSRLSDRGYRVRVFCRQRVTGSSARTFRGMDLVRVPSLPLGAFDTLTHSIASIVWLVVHRQKPRDVVLHFLSGGNGVVVPLAKLLGYRTVVTVDGAEWKRDKWGKLEQRLLRSSFGLTARFADVVVTDSRRSQDLVRELWGRDSVYIPYGLPEESDHSDAYNTEVLKRHDLEEGNFILFVGRFVPEKGIHTLVAAHKALGQTRPALVLVGGDPNESAYGRELRDAAASDVSFLGGIYGEEISVLLRNAFLYVQPSSIEGTSPMLLNAVMTAARVVASDIPENVETMGPDGVYFPVGDSESLASTIVNMANGSIRVDTESLRDRAKARYDWDAVTDAYVDTYVAAQNLTVYHSDL